MSQELSKSVCVVLARDVRILGLLAEFEVGFWSFWTTSRASDILRLVGARADAVIVEIDGPSKRLFELVAIVREINPELPALLIDSQLGADNVNEAQRFGVEYVCAPWGRANISSFLQRSGDRDGASAGEFPSVVGHFATAHNLTAAENRVLLAGIESTGHKHLAATLGVAETTVRSHVRHILAKTGEASLEAVICPLRQSILRHLARG